MAVRDLAGPGASRRASPTVFTPKTLSFLRALKRHNDRDWFRARRDQYETHVRAPMVEAVERLAVDLRTFAPDLVASPRVSLFRIYRDTRFSENKAPLKTQMGAVFPRRGLPRHGGAALYFEIGPDGVWIGGGLYAPGTPQLLAVRSHLAANLRRFRAIVESPVFRRATGGLHGEQLQRIPRGFPSDHEAARYLKYRQFLAGRDFPAALAADGSFYSTVLRVFRQTAPLVRFLNEPLVAPPASRV
ncbi:MAG: DUF2461 domain-containing protein [Acidobacteria bacterium]|nr:DUF2461 domain-containing protein [Acidobacteriota bacterium]